LNTYSKTYCVLHGENFTRDNISRLFGS